MKAAQQRKTVMTAKGGMLEKKGKKGRERRRPKRCQRVTQMRRTVATTRRKERDSGIRMRTTGKKEKRAGTVTAKRKRMSMIEVWHPVN